MKLSFFRGAWPLAAICCLGLLGLLVAATIVLALIPIYLPGKQTAASTTSSSDTISFFLKIKEYFSLIL